MIRKKNPKVDLKLEYKRVFPVCLFVSVLLTFLVFFFSREFDVKAYAKPPQRIILQIEDIPETHHQIKRPPPPPRPSVPIEVEAEDLVDDVTIESTDLDLSQIPADIPPPPPLIETFPVEHLADEEEEIVKFWHAEVKPKLVKSVVPEYPEIARKAGIEGKVFLRLLIGKDGKVEEVEFLKGPVVFKDSAIEVVMQYLFSPATQNDKPVRVWAAQMIRFKLK